MSPQNYWQIAIGDEEDNDEDDNDDDDDDENFCGPVEQPGDCCQF